MRYNCDKMKVREIKKPEACQARMRGGWLSLRPRLQGEPPARPRGALKSPKRRRNFCLFRHIVCHWWIAAGQSDAKSSLHPVIRKK
jgi:hypothetical protein